MANVVNMNSLLNGKDSRWLQLEVCREFQRNKCSRQDTECKFAHPPANVEVQNGKVTACYDSIKVSIIPVPSTYPTTYLSTYIQHLSNLCPDIWTVSVESTHTHSLLSCTCLNRSLYAFILLLSSIIHHGLSTVNHRILNRKNTAEQCWICLCLMLQYCMPPLNPLVAVFRSRSLLLWTNCLSLSRIRRSWLATCAFYA